MGVVAEVGGVAVHHEHEALQPRRRLVHAELLEALGHAPAVHRHEEVAHKPHVGEQRGRVGRAEGAAPAPVE